MIGPAQESDREELVQLFRRNHPDTWSRPLRLDPQHESQIFVVREHGKIIGIATVSYIYVGTDPYGVIHELDVVDDSDFGLVSRRLVDACRNWLTERDALIVYMRVPGAVTLQQAGARELVMDAATGTIKAEGDGWGPNLPAPMRLPRERWV